MAQSIHICKACKKYTFEDTCSVCKKKTESPAPAKYSPDDKYGRFRREVKKDSYEDRGLL